MKRLARLFRRFEKHPTLAEVKRLGYDSFDAYYHDLYDGEHHWVRF